MKTTLMALAAGACALLLAGPAAAHVDVRIHAQVPAYYYPPPPPRYAPSPYYVYADPAWQARREMAWRHEQWLRREEWRRRQWYREQWRYRHHHRHHHRHGWDGGY